jgi:hypothetical protein
MKSPQSLNRIVREFKNTTGRRMNAKVNVEVL